MVNPVVTTRTTVLSTVAGTLDVIAVDLGSVDPKSYEGKGARPKVKSIPMVAPIPVPVFLAKDSLSLEEIKKAREERRHTKFSHFSVGRTENDIQI